MARVTYVHHYYPALYFAILATGFSMDWTTRGLGKQVKWAIYFVLYVVVISLFIHFRAIVFGMEGKNAQWSHLRWLSTWRMSDP